MAFLRNNSKPNTGIVVAFPTCIYQGQYADHVKYNQLLLDEINKIKDDQTITKSSEESYGVGWTSYYATNGDFNSKYNLINNPITEKLQSFIWESLYEYLSYIGINTSNIPYLRFGVMWANINNKYSYHSSHIHPNSYYSGVYYVKVPKNSGKILFTDPRNSIRTFELEPSEKQKFSDAVIRQVPIDPFNGGLVLFPSWLAHEVEQQLSDDERVSIAFNIISDYEKIASKVKEATQR
jgi:uncharacterized protein (TIGR02466 family)